jgi:8-oxo-dGTP pyrophosphatase MutT (NUDIX family)
VGDRRRSGRSSSRPEQAAAIPFRRNGAKVQVCLIRRWDSTGWSIPKGTVDPGDSLSETSLKETWEEAGLRGALHGECVGTYRYQKLGASLTVAVYLIEVTTQADVWDEAHLRERKWFALNEAIARLSDHPVQPLLDRAVNMLAT